MRASLSASLPVVALVLLLTVGGVWVSRLAAAQPGDVEIAGFATSLHGRSAGQRHNAALAVRAINGKVIASGAVFSFNKTVGSWTVDRGYVKAPVSFDGELVPAFGGGVCQTSTTLYNTALLAGLRVLERHHHVFAPSYVSPGRDAAVAQYDIDLRFQNPYTWPVHIQARIMGDRLEVRLLGREQPKAGVEIVTDILSTTPPARLTYTIPTGDGSAQRTYLRTPGATGYRVITYRIFAGDGREVRREQLSDDSYQSMNRLVAVMMQDAP
jgi:vancomycin resistance protein YoaR